MREGNLYAESRSDNSEFGGVNQTFMKDKNRIYANNVGVSFQGDGNNENIGVYEDYTGDSADIFIWKYTTEKPDQTIRVQLQP